MGHYQKGLDFGSQGVGVIFGKDVVCQNLVQLKSPHREV